MSEDFFSLRSNGMVGVISREDFSIHASEWWNGEGIDFDIDSNKSEPQKRIHLHVNEINDLCILALAMEFIDLDEVTEKANEMKIKNQKDQEILERMRDRF